MSGLSSNRRAQIILGLIFGIVFGFFLQKGGVTDYNVIIGQLLLTDFTVIKVMLSAVIVGMAGFHILKRAGYVRSHAAEGSLGANVIGGLIFGIGFALLGYCPGTVAGAVGTGAIDALFGGVSGLLAGTGLFAEAYPKLHTGILKWKPFPAVIVPDLFRMKTITVVFILEAGMVMFLFLLEYYGL